MRTTTLITATMLLLAIALPASAAPKPGRVELLTERGPTVYAGESVWVTLNWTAERQAVSEFSATVKEEKGIEVDYPTNTPGFTGLMDGHHLDVGEIDYTAIKVTVPFDQTKDVKLKVTVTYDDGNGKTETDKFTVKIPVVAYDDHGTVVQLASSASIGLGASEWVDVDFTTKAPRADAVSMVVTDAAGLSISYPGLGTATSLHHDDRLSMGETDTARFLVDTTDTTAGVHVLSTETTYVLDGETQTLTGTVQITVTG